MTAEALIKPAATKGSSARTRPVSRPKVKLKKGRPKAKAAFPAATAGAAQGNEAERQRSAPFPDVATEYPESPYTSGADTARRVRTSEVLLNLLSRHPDEVFTVEKILHILGASAFGASLMLFSLTELLPIPIPGFAMVTVLPTGILGAQLAAGRREMRLPSFILNRKVPRKALVAAIYSILPILRRAEKISKPRWKWTTSPIGKRLLGAFIVLLALSIAFPIPGFNLPQTIAVFTIGLGLVEEDGIIICTGVLMGIASLIFLGGILLGLTSLLGF